MRTVVVLLFFLVVTGVSAVLPWLLNRLVGIESFWLSALLAVVWGVLCARVFIAWLARRARRLRPVPTGEGNP